MGGTASQDRNLTQLGKVSKKKPPIEKNLSRSGNLFQMHLATIQSLTKGVIN